MTTRTSFKPQNAAYMLLSSCRCCSMLSAVLAPVEPAMGASPLAAAVPDAWPPPAPATAADISPAAIIPPPSLRPAWVLVPSPANSRRGPLELAYFFFTYLRSIARRHNVRAK